MQSLTMVFIFITTLLSLMMPAQAQPIPVVQIVFFYNPDCDNCQKVMTTDLPPLQARYGAQLEILQINTSNPEGIKLYQAMSRHFNLSDDRLGTPAIVVGKSVLVGTDEIPAGLTGLIEDGLASGGVSWPDIPGLDSFIISTVTPYPSPSLLVYPQPSGQITENTDPTEQSSWERYAENFKKDPVANSLALIVLTGMVISILIILTILVRSILAENPAPAPHRITSWLILLLIFVGIGVAGYLTFVEVGERQAICGPVGNCNAVQTSSYAKLFDFLPIGVLGLLGYATLLIAWGIYKFGPMGLHTLSVLALWGMSLFGVAFSIYLTFLEPFVIGATCMWCLISALVITALLWITTPLAQVSLTAEDIDDEELPELPET